MADLELSTGIDLIYALLMEDADRMDRMYLHAQLVSGSEDLRATEHRDTLDQELLTPIGPENDDLDALLSYLRG